MTNKEKLTEATILALQGKLNESKIKVHFIDDYTYDNKDDAINDFNDRLTDLQSDGLENLSHLAQEVVDRLDNDETNIVISDDEINQATAQDEEYSSDINDSNENEVDYNNSKVFSEYYSNYDEYGIGNRSYDPDEYVGKMIKRSARPNSLASDYEIVSKYPDFSQISNLITDGNLIVIGKDYVIGKVVDVVATYVQYNNERDDAYVNYSGFNKKIKSILRNMKEKVSNDIVYAGIDLTDNVLFGQDAINHFKTVYDKWANSKSDRLDIYYM